MRALAFLLFMLPAVGSATVYTVCPSGCDHTTIEGALNAATPTEINVSGNWTSAADTTVATVDIPNVVITVTDAHAGVWDDSKYRMECDNPATGCFVVTAAGVVIDGIQCDLGVGSNTSDECIRFDPSGTEIFTLKNAILTSSSTANDLDGVHITNGSGTLNAENLIGYGWTRGAIHTQATTGTQTHNVNVLSSTFYNNGTGANEPAGGGVAVTCSNSAATINVNVHNTVSVENDTQDSNDYTQNGTTCTANWSISYSMDSDNSIATRDAGGTDNLASRTAVVAATCDNAANKVCFVNLTAGSVNLTLVDDVDNNAHDAHVVLTAEGLTIGQGTSDLDIAGTLRVCSGAHHQGSGFDMGAFEVDDGAGACGGGGGSNAAAVRRTLGLH